MGDGEKRNVVAAALRGADGTPALDRAGYPGGLEEVLAAQEERKHSVLVEPQEFETPGVELPPEEFERKLRGEQYRGRTVYLAGPMTGYEEYNFPLFNAVAAELRERFGMNVLNPAELEPDTGLSIEEYMEGDLPAVCRSAAVICLPGWEDSKGADIEVTVAKKLGKPVYEWPELRRIDGGVDKIAFTDTYKASRFWGRAAIETPVASRHVDCDPETILQEADRLVAHDRQDQYGHPLDDFGKVVGMAQALWGRGPRTEEEHAVYMVLVKLAREANRPKRDNRVDAAGYLKTLDMVIEERAIREWGDEPF